MVMKTTNCFYDDNKITRKNSLKKQAQKTTIPPRKYQPASKKKKLAWNCRKSYEDLASVNYVFKDKKKNLNHT